VYLRQRVSKLGSWNILLPYAKMYNQRLIEKRYLQIAPAEIRFKLIIVCCRCKSVK